MLAIKYRRGSGSGGNPFNQDLNTTDCPTFACLFLDGYLVLKDSDGNLWDVLVGTDGTLSTQPHGGGGLTGQPIGLLLGLTYA